MISRLKRLTDLEAAIKRLRPTGRPLTFFEDEIQPGMYHMGEKASDHLGAMDYDLSADLFTKAEVDQYTTQNGGDHIAVVFIKMDTLGGKEVKKNE